MRAWVEAGFSESRFWDLTPRVYLIQMEGAVAVARRQADVQMSAAWLAGVLPRLKSIPPLSEFVGPRPPPLTPEEASLELQAQMRVTRDIMAKEGRIRSWAEWQAAL